MVHISVTCLLPVSLRSSHNRCTHPYVWLMFGSHFLPHLFFCVHSTQWQVQPRADFGVISVHFNGTKALCSLLHILAVLWWRTFTSANDAVTLSFTICFTLCSCFKRRRRRRSLSTSYLACKARFSKQGYFVLCAFIVKASHKYKSSFRIAGECSHSYYSTGQGFSFLCTYLSGKSVCVCRDCCSVDVMVV